MGNLFYKSQDIANENYDFEKLMEQLLCFDLKIWLNIRPTSGNPNYWSCCKANSGIFQTVQFWHKLQNFLSVESHFILYKYKYFYSFKMQLIQKSRHEVKITLQLYEIQHNLMCLYICISRIKSVRPKVISSWV